MKEITSVQNQLIKDVHSLTQKKGRNESGLFLIEGYKGVVEALKWGIKIENIFVKEDFVNEIPDFVYEIYAVNEQILRKISTTENPPEIVATARQFSYSPKDLLKQNNPVILLLENIKDPGNLGTIIRTAAACSISGIILTDDTVDIFNPKTVRATAANLWKVPIVFIKDKANIKNLLEQFLNFQYLATVVKEDNKPVLYYDVDYKKPTVIMFGSEAEGLSGDLIKQADKLITIPMDESVESLNLSISVGVVLYESIRQRKFTY